MQFTAEGVAAVAARRGANRISLLGRAITPLPELQLPPRERVGDFLAKLVKRDGVDYVAEALINSCDESDVRAFCKVLCDREYGVASADGNGGVFVY